MDYTDSILSYFHVLKKYKFKILLLIIVSMVWNGMVGMNAPRSYTSTATALLPITGSGGMQEAQGFMQALSLAPRTVDQTVRAIINSNRMGEDIIERFDIQKRYGIASKEAAIRMIRKKIFMYSTEPGITLSVDATADDPKLAADIANFCLSNLDVINQELQIFTDRQVVKILDRAIPPSSSQSRGIIRKVAVGVIFSGLVGIGLAFLLEYIGASKKEKGIKKC